MVKGKSEVLNRGINISVFANCYDPKTNKTFQMGSPECMKCFQKIHDDTNAPCGIYENGMFFKRATLLEAEKLLGGSGGKPTTPQFTSTMHG